MLPLYGVVAAAGVVFLVKLSLFLGFILLDLLCEHNLSNKGCWVFSPIRGFPRINLLYFLSFLIIVGFSLFTEH